MEVLFTVKEVSKLFKCNTSLVYALIKGGHLNVLKLGQLKVPKYEVDDFLKRNIGKDFSDLDNIKKFEMNSAK
ncbi:MULTISPECIES: helix-turn-helix domain-containing protein [Bacillus]|uniref:helix-turn-helix domain-containing protein n=1 Tax=Bacillus TaxID=1386 RepID=UPI0002E07332|nr:MULTISPECIES: helix-turn-helix domain-containing protein [Bacillus]